MSAIPHESGLPSPSPSRSGAGTGTGNKKGAFPPLPKSVRVWAVIIPEGNPSQSESGPSDTAGQARKVYFSPAAWVAVGPLAVLLAAVLAGSLAFVLWTYLGKCMPV
jgi:hypothetical protein